MNTGTNTKTTPERLQRWWGETDFRQMEQITGFHSFDFDPPEGYQAFVDACDRYWTQLSAEEKQRIWENYN
jgi:hypothetical protein